MNERNVLKLSLLILMGTKQGYLSMTRRQSYGRPFGAPCRPPKNKENMSKTKVKTMLVVSVEAEGTIHEKLSPSMLPNSLMFSKYGEKKPLACGSSLLLRCSMMSMLPAILICDFVSSWRRIFGYIAPVPLQSLFGSVSFFCFQGLGSPLKVLVLMVIGLSQPLLRRFGLRPSTERYAPGKIAVSNVWMHVGRTSRISNCILMTFRFITTSCITLLTHALCTIICILISENSGI